MHYAHESVAQDRKSYLKQVRVNHLDFDSQGHVVDREELAIQLQYYLRKIKWQHTYDDAELVTVLFYTNYLMPCVIAEITGWPEEKLPVRDAAKLLNLLQHSIDQDGVAIATKKQILPLNVRREILSSYSEGTRVCAYIEAGIIDRKKAERLVRSSVRCIRDYNQTQIAKHGLAKPVKSLAQETVIV